ncbi:MAG: LysM peptidoglycan-binding domain-containing protein [Chloroflexi bacterium]|nr:LysM peptidoglycan-binding domain-containing protein [Chloroflexota bacterium]
MEASALETDDTDPGDGAAGADTLPAARADAGTDAASTTSVVERVLHAGETLEAVAAIFGTTAVALAAENQIDDIQTVHAGQVLRISVAGEVVVWVVEDGDTLTELARRFDISVASLVAINGLADGDALSVGQRLTILPGR